MRKTSGKFEPLAPFEVELVIADYQITGSGTTIDRELEVLREAGYEVDAFLDEVGLIHFKVASK